MKKLILLFIVYSCNTSNHKTPQKPFIIIEKNARGIMYSKYSVIDKNGIVFTFEDRDSKYSFGDTIK